MLQIKLQESTWMRIDGLQWDDEKIEHIIKHGISIPEVEDICFGPHLVYQAKYGRYILYGQTGHGRYTMVVLKRLYGNHFEPRTSREMTEREKKNYKKKIK